MRVLQKIERAFMLLKKKKIISVPEIVGYPSLLKDKVALVIGGTGGIGSAISLALMRSGCNVIVTGSTQKSFDKLDQQLCDSDCVEKLIFDLSDINSYDAKLKEASEKFGKLDILICSSGVHSESFGFFDMTEGEYDRVMGINLKAPFFLCQRFANYIVEKKIEDTHICLVSSSRGSEPAYSPYGISKWGLNGMIKGLAQELIPYGIVVNAVAPGTTATPLIGVLKNDSIATFDNHVGRMALPEEVANIVEMLVGETGNMIIGEIIHISGGRGTFDIR